MKFDGGNSFVFDYHFCSSHLISLFLSVSTVCPEITDFVVPPIMFAQSQEKVYISVQASPPPPSRHLRIFLESARGTSSRDLNYTSVQETTSITNSTYIHIFEVPSDVPQGATLTFEATLNLETCEGAYQRRMTQKILNGECCHTKDVLLTGPM